MKLSESTIAELTSLLKKARSEVTSSRFIAQADRKRALESAAHAQNEEESFHELSALMRSLGIEDEKGDAE